MAFPRFFGHLEIMPKCLENICCTKCKTKQQTGDDDQLLDDNALEDKENENTQVISTTDDVKPISIAGTSHFEPFEIENKEEDTEHRKEHENAQNCYFKLAQLTTSSPWKYIVPIVVYIVMSPVIYVLFTEYKYSMEFTDFFPSGSSSVMAYKRMIVDFPPSFLMPYYLLGVNENEQEIWTEETFSAFCETTRQLMKVCYVMTYPFNICQIPKLKGAI